MPHEQTEQFLTKDFVPTWNFIDNSYFDFWTRNTTQTISGYGSSDRWGHGLVGDTHVVSRQAFTFGELFPDGTPTPDYYCRKVITSVAGINNYAVSYQRIPYLSLLAGRKITLSFYAKSSVDKSIGIEFIYEFGTGGTPSALINGIGTRVINLTTVWKKYTVVVPLPALASGVVFGTTRPGNLSLIFWEDAGSTYSSRASNIGQASATIDMTAITIMAGAHSRDTAPFPKSYILDLNYCQRFYIELDFIMSRHNSVSDGNGGFGAGLYLYEMAMPFICTAGTVTFYTNRSKTNPKITLGTTISTEVTPSSYVISSIWPQALLLYPSVTLATVGDYLYGTACIDLDW